MVVEGMGIPALHLTPCLLLPYACARPGILIPVQEELRETPASAVSSTHTLELLATCRLWHCVLLVVCSALAVVQKK